MSDQASLDAMLRRMNDYARRKFGPEYEVRYEGMPRGPHGGHEYRLYRTARPTPFHASSAEGLRALLDAASRRTIE